MTIGKICIENGCAILYTEKTMKEGGREQSQKTENGKKETMKISQKLFRRLAMHSIVWQMTIICGIIVLIPMILIGSAYLSSLHESLLAEADRTNRQYLQQMKRSINENLNKTNYVADQLLFANEFSYMLKNDPNLRSDSDLQPEIADAGIASRSLIALQNSIINIRYTYPSQFYQILVYTPNPNVLEVEGLIYQDARIQAADYYQAFLGSGEMRAWGAIRKAELFPSANTSHIHILDPYRTKWVLPYYVRLEEAFSREYVGMLEIDILVERLVNEDFLYDDDTELNFLLWGENGQLYFSSKKNETVDSQVFSFIEEAGTLDFNENNQTQHLIYDSIPSARLRVGAMIPKRELTKAAYRVTLVLVAAAIVGFGFVIFLSRKMAQGLFKRLVTIDAYIAKVEQGEFSGQIETEGSDEISRIAKSFNHMTDRLNELIHNVVAVETARQDAEIRALQAQINPHFLYNTLENLRMQCEIEENYVISDALFSLARLMRYSIENTREAVSVKQELDALDNYVKLMSIRFSADITFLKKVPQELMGYRIPKLTFQPLVENAFVHGMTRDIAQFRIEISAKWAKGYLIFDIFNNGHSIDAEKMEEIRDKLHTGEETFKTGSIGLSNVSRRLSMQYGENSGLSLESGPWGTRVRLYIFQPDQGEDASD